MKKTLYLMRHGQTLFNVRKKIQGWCDAPLTQLGQEQAKVAKAYFDNSNITFTEAYASTSERASDTLEIITDMPYTREKGLKEWNFGTFEGESEELNPPLPYGDFFKTYNGEGEMEVRKRVSSTIQLIMEREGHDQVLAVSHGAAIANFYREWEECSNIKRTSKISNCAIFKYEYDGSTFKLLEIINHDFSSITK